MFNSFAHRSRSPAKLSTADTTGGTKSEIVLLICETSLFIFARDKWYRINRLGYI